MVSNLDVLAEFGVEQLIIPTISIRITEFDIQVPIWFSRILK